MALTRDATPKPSPTQRSARDILQDGLKPLPAPKATATPKPTPAPKAPAAPKATSKPKPPPTAKDLVTKQPSAPPEWAQRMNPDAPRFEGGKLIPGNQPKFVDGKFVDPKVEAFQRATHTLPEDLKPLPQGQIAGAPKRRQLTDEEWARLSEPQKNQVRFNSQLLAAFDADQTESPKDRRNTKALYSQLGLDDKTLDGLKADLKGNLGAAATYQDLFAPKPPQQSVAGPSHRDPYTGRQTNTVGEPLSTRQQQVNSITAKLNAYFASQKSATAQGQLDSALADTSMFKFDNPQSQADYSEAFDALRVKENLSQRPWSAAAQGMRDFGYDPADFSKYMMDRLSALPQVEGQTTVDDLKSWMQS